MSLINFCKDFLFPSQCVGCGCWGLVLCANCQQRLLSASPAVVRRHFAFYRYNHFASQIQKQGKYRGYWVVVQALVADIGLGRISDLGAWLKACQVKLLVPIPLTQSAQKQRGYNQAQIIADILASEYDLTTVKALVKIRANKSQARQSNWEKRRTNVQGVYQLAHPNVIKGQVALLVDDVVTSGSTMTEASRILYQGGSKAVYWFSLFRAG